MPKYNVGWTYTLWTVEEAEDEAAAIRKSCETDHLVSCGPTAILEINEYSDPIVNQEGFENAVKAAYLGGVCPDCGADIPDDVADGDSCGNCTHVFWSSSEPK